MMRIKRIYRKIPKFYQDPEGFEKFNTYCGSDIKNLEPLVQLLIEDGLMRFEDENRWLNLYLSEYSDQPFSFHQEFYKSELENYIFYTLQAAQNELFEQCEELKRIRKKFIDFMLLIFVRLKCNNIHKLRLEVEEWDNKIYNQYLMLFETKIIETIGKSEVYYFDEQ